MKNFKNTLMFALTFGVGIFGIGFLTGLPAIDSLSAVLGAVFGYWLGSLDRSKS